MKNYHPGDKLRSQAILAFKNKSMMKTTLLFAGCFLLCGHFSYAQSVYEACGLHKSAHSDFYTVDVEQARCLARHSDKDITAFYTYAPGCGSSERGLPLAVELARQYGMDLYLLLMDKEDDKFSTINPVSAMIDTVSCYELKAVIITDSLYSPKSFKRLNAPIRKFIRIDGERYYEKYTRFLKEIIPPDFEPKFDRMKMLVLNRQGEVLLVTSYEDVLVNGDGTVDGFMLREKVKQCVEKERKINQHQSLRSHKLQTCSNVYAKS